MDARDAVAAFRNGDGTVRCCRGRSRSRSRPGRSAMPSMFRNIANPLAFKFPEDECRDDDIATNGRRRMIRAAATTILDDDRIGPRIEMTIPLYLHATGGGGGEAPKADAREKTRIERPTLTRRRVAPRRVARRLWLRRLIGPPRSLPLSDSTTCC